MYIKMESSIVRVADGAYIPVDPENVDYSAYLEWVGEGNVPSKYEMSLEAAAALVRAKRDALLAASDWSQLGDVPAAISEAWVPYRQSLRDVPRQSGFPHRVEWPAQPL